jgi:D-xylose 1-dehydrogenase (NADP+, D-xylono-1,5-lactone-forming)
VVNWALLSTASINERLLYGVRGVDGARMLAVGSRDAARARAYADAREIERSYGSYEALLADPDVDIVYVSLPNGMHVEWTRRALQAGKHVLCEKPLSRDPAQVTELFELAQANGLHLSEAFMYRHHPQTRKLKELIQAGAIGELRLIRGHFSFNAAPGDPRLAAGMDGGGLMDVGCYAVSMARYLAGEPERVYAERLLGGDGVDVVLAGLLRFAGGVLAHFDCGLAMPDRAGLEVVGSAGTLFVEDPWLAATPGIELRREGGGAAEQIDVAQVDPYFLEALDLTQAVSGAQPPLLGRDDALGQARALEALQAAAQGGQVMTLTPPAAAR